MIPEDRNKAMLRMTGSIVDRLIENPDKLRDDEVLTSAADAVICVVLSIAKPCAQEAMLDAVCGWMRIRLESELAMRAALVPRRDAAPGRTH